MKDNDEETNYVIASDTDSVYINLSKRYTKCIMKENLYRKTKVRHSRLRLLSFLTEWTEKIEPFIDKCYQDLATYMNAYDQKMFMKREVIADRVSRLQRKDMY